MIKYTSFKRKAIGILLLLLASSFQSLFAEGSKDWYPAEADSYTGDKKFRSWIASGVPTSGSNVANIAAPFPTYGTMKVYAKAGEKIYIASSVMMISTAHIDWRCPDGSNGSFFCNMEDRTLQK